MKRIKHSCLWLLATALFAFGAQASGQMVTLPDLDGDGIANIEDRDIDNDGTFNAMDRNIDGGTAVSGPFRGQYIGDGLSNGHDSEADMDADGIENAIDTDIDSDGAENDIDEDFNSDGIIDTIDFAYNHDSPIDQELARPIADLVTEKLLKKLMPTTGASLRVLVNSIKEPYGGWNCTTADGISINGIWRYPAGQPDQIDLFVGELAGESQIYAQYPKGPVTLYTWQQSEPVKFCFSTLPMQVATIAQFHQYISGHSNAYPTALPSTITESSIITFYGDLPAFDGIDAIEQQQRDLFSIARY